MDWSLTPEQLEIQRSVAALCSDAHAASEDEAVIWRRFADAGWLGMHLPEAAGGLECGAVEVALLMQTLGLHGMPLPFVQRAIVFGGLLAAVTPDAQPLAATIAGEEIGVALIDPDLTVGDQVGKLSLVGSSVPLPGGHSAKHLLLLDNSQSAAWLVDVGADDVVREDVTLHGAGSAALFHWRDGGHVNAIELPGAECAQAWRDRIEPLAQLALAAFNLGAMEAALSASTAYSRERRQFGQRLADFQALQHLLADAGVDVELTGSLVFGAAMALDAGRDDARRLALSARVYADEAAKRVCKSAIQLHGAIATTDELEVGHHLSRVAVNANQLGTTQQLLRRLAVSAD